MDGVLLSAEGYTCPPFLAKEESCYKHLYVRVCVDVKLYFPWTVVPGSGIAGSYGRLVLSSMKS